MNELTATAPSPARVEGTITRINAKVGEMVVTGMMNNPGTKILEVGDLSEMLVVAQVWARLAVWSASIPTINV